MAARRRYKTKIRREVMDKYAQERETNRSILEFRRVCGFDSVSSDVSNLKLVLYRDTTARLPKWTFYNDFGYQELIARGLRLW